MRALRNWLAIYVISEVTIGVTDRARVDLSGSLIGRARRQDFRRPSELIQDS